MEFDKYIFFYGSIYSQWAMRDIEIDGETYNCNEQYMMYKKAHLFGDLFALGKIMSSSDPAIQKSWGRRVENFDKDKWEVIARDVVYKANLAKFTQHEDWKQQLLATGDKEIVEASPTDCVWGIGMSCDDPGITDPKNWRGTNWLGEAIMKVREHLNKEIKDG
jgi:hypothetical protein